jgi:hypothetical protein
MNSSDAAAFAASRAIENGEWDRHLAAISVSIKSRLRQIERVLSSAKDNGR